MDSIITALPRRSVWNGWGDPNEAKPFPEAVWPLLKSKLGITKRRNAIPPVSLADLKMPASKLSEAANQALTEIVGAEYVRQDKLSRAEHLGGKSYIDLYRARRGDGAHAPDAVVFPADAKEVEAVLKCCEKLGIALVPFGGGTSVVGGVEPDRGTFETVIQLDLRRLNKISNLDQVSRKATFGAGMRGPEVEAALQPFGLTLGHYPQSHQQASLGGYVATRSAGQASTGYGRIDENVLGAQLVTPRGILNVGAHAPASAAGPRLLDLAVGSEGALGIITEATLKVHEMPSMKKYSCWSFPDMDSASQALRTLSQTLGHGLMPQVCRISDPDETWVSLSMGGKIGRAIQRYTKLRGQNEPCLGIFLWEGTASDSLSYRKFQTEKVLKAHRAIRLPNKIAKHWEHNRFLGPYLRDELIDRQIFVETLETATSWAQLRGLYTSVRGAIMDTLDELGTPGIVQTHISHVYESGASLYFTYVADEASDPQDQWLRVKMAANKAILDAGGTITHHHGVGTAHRDAMAEEIGDLGSQILRDVKKKLDPTGFLNPGKLIK